MFIHLWLKCGWWPTCLSRRWLPRTVFLPRNTFSPTQLHHHHRRLDHHKQLVSNRRSGDGGGFVPSRLDGHVEAVSLQFSITTGPDCLSISNVSRTMSKGCYTCRRRRIVCDNGRPTCRKCRDAGKECLGYQKPLVWVKGGVASRGKMMGLSFDDVTSNQESPGGASMGCCSTDSSEQTGQGLCKSETLPDDANLQVQVQTLPEATLAKYYNNDRALVHVRRLPAESPTFLLVDPLFQDMDRLSRLYVSHCKTPM